MTRSEHGFQLVRNLAVGTIKAVASVPVAVTGVLGAIVEKDAVYAYQPVAAVLGSGVKDIFVDAPLHAIGILSPVKAEHAIDRVNERVDGLSINWNDLFYERGSPVLREG